MAGGGTVAERKVKALLRAGEGVQVISPALARPLRRRLQLTLGREYRGYLHFLREARKQALDTGCPLKHSAP